MQVVAIVATCELRLPIGMCNPLPRPIETWLQTLGLTVTLHAPVRTLECHSIRPSDRIPDRDSFEMCSCSDFQQWGPRQHVPTRTSTPKQCWISSAQLNPGRIDVQPQCTHNLSVSSLRSPDIQIDQNRLRSSSEYPRSNYTCSDLPLQSIISELQACCVAGEGGCKRTTCNGTLKV